jgi:hypothetical protein
MNGEKLAIEMEKLLVRYRAGLISLDQAKAELALLVGFLKAYEMEVAMKRLRYIEAVIEERRLR